MRAQLPFAIATALILTGCGGGDAPAPAESNAVETATPVTPTPEPVATETDQASPAPEAPSPAPGGAIPAAFVGTWGAGPGGCAAGSTGRLKVEPDQLVFYESAAKPGRVERPSPDSIRLDLAFTGEGESWTQSNTLTLLDDGVRMRREQANMQPITYERCANG